MKNILNFILIFFVLSVCKGYAQEGRNESSFDSDWKFSLGENAGAGKSSFDDKLWRSVDLPHDWSIENLPGQTPGKVIGPFSKESMGATATGYTVGGTGWYRKTFTLARSKKFSQTIISFDGVYMNSDVWLNGKFVGTHPYGYTAFYYDITKFLNTPGEPNVIAIKVKNEGKNSRWYSGSGIYRHVRLIQKQSVSIAQNGILVNTQSISGSGADIAVSTSIENGTPDNVQVKLQVRIIDAKGKVANSVQTEIKDIKSGISEITQRIKVSNAQLWSTEVPNLYTVEIKVIANEKPADTKSITFGIRTIHIDAENGFLLNGKRVRMKGGCLHQDNGFLGAATIDRAEERRVELMKANGFNAIRTSHNPPSSQFLDACDRNGILVIDEAFDMWERPKNPQDYHLYFKEWWQKDLESMIYRDRNHPSVVLWSIGNEINERADSLGFAIRKRLVAEVHRLDSTRLVTEAICSFWDHWGQKWSTTEQAFTDLDVGGYNYLNTQYEADHKEFPNRIMVGTESYPAESNAYWQQVQKNPWVIGDFVWTAMDYLGETGCGNARLGKTPSQRVGLQSWPWFNAYCGDIDLCGFKKSQSFYRDVVWDRSKIEMLVHSPIPDGMVETTTYWGWPDELQSWNWSGNEGKLMDVRVFTKSGSVRLELNGKVIAEQTTRDTTGITYVFKVPYKPGVLKAIALKGGKEIANKELKTTGIPANIRLTADRTKIKADRNDLSYIKIEVTDSEGNLITNNDVAVKLTVSGNGEIAGSGNACPTDMESFNSPVCKTFHGQALAIIRPLKDKKAGMVTLRAESDGLKTEKLTITIK